MSDHENLTLYKRPPFGKCQRPGAFIGVNTVSTFAGVSDLMWHAQLLLALSLENEAVMSLPGEEKGCINHIHLTLCSDVGMFIHAIKVKFRLACLNTARITDLRAYVTAQNWMNSYESERMSTFPSDCA